MDGLGVQQDPLGVVLVIGAWNFPVSLTLTPVIGNSVAVRSYITSFRAVLAQRRCYYLRLNLCNSSVNIGALASGNAVLLKVIILIHTIHF